MLRRQFEYSQDGEQSGCYFRWVIRSMISNDITQKMTSEYQETIFLIFTQQMYEDHEEKPARQGAQAVQRS